MDGENWEELSSLKNITYTNQANTIEDAKINTKSFEISEPKEVQYVKIVADRTNGNWFTARAFNFYQDITKNPHPTAGVGYSTTDATNKNVIARLINPSTSVTITNNNGSDTYVFKENGTFTFKFEDENGIKGETIAKVDWIDKKAPTAKIEYSTTSKTSEEVVAKLIPSEKVTIINNDTNNVEDKDTNSDPFTCTFTQNGEYTFKFQDAAGNVGNATAKVNWIVEETEKPTAPDTPITPNTPGDSDNTGSITSNKYSIKEKYIYRILPKTNCKEFKNNVITKQTLVFMNNKGNNMKEEDIITTGSTLKIGDKLQYNLIVIGDVDNDGEITINDLAKVKLHLIQKELLKGDSLKAADVDNDGEITINDIAQIKLILIDKMQLK